MLKALQFRVFPLVMLLCFPCLSQAAETAETKDVLAIVEGRQITETDIVSQIEGQMLRINNQIYSVKKQAIDAAITDHLLSQEAEKRELSQAQLLEQEVNAKVETVSDEEIEQFYNTNKARLGNKPLAEVKDRIAQHLQNKKRQEQQQAFLQELRKAAKIEVLLKPPVVDVPVDGAPVRGSANAQVTLVEFSDFQ